MRDPLSLCRLKTAVSRGGHYDEREEVFIERQAMRRAIRSGVLKLASQTVAKALFGCRKSDVADSDGHRQDCSQFRAARRSSRTFEAQYARTIFIVRADYF